MRRTGGLLLLVVLAALVSALPSAEAATPNGITTGTLYEDAARETWFMDLHLAGSELIGGQRFTGVIDIDEMIGTYGYRYEHVTIPAVAIHSRDGKVKGTCAGLGGSASSPGGGYTVASGALKLVCTGRVKPGPPAPFVIRTTSGSGGVNILGIVGGLPLTLAGAVSYARDLVNAELDMSCYPVPICTTVFGDFTKTYTLTKN